MLPIPDPREMEDGEKEAIVSALDGLMAREEELDEIENDDEFDPLEVKEDKRDALDRVVLATMGMEDRLEELKQGVSGLVEMRRDGSGERTKVLVGRTEEKEIIELNGVVEA
jgi:hypothetical protein